MASLTAEQAAALLEIREIILESLDSFKLTAAMLSDKSLRQLLILHYLTVGHRNYPGYWHIVQVLDEIFGKEAMTERPKPGSGRSSVEIASTVH